MYNIFMFEEELENLLKKNWSDEEKRLITALTENAIYYRKFIPKSFKQDILNALQICNTLKTELEIYKEQCKCIASEKQSNENQESEINENQEQKQLDNEIIKQSEI